MARRKTAKSCEMSFWMSKNQDNHEGRFLQVGNSLLLSAEFQDLTGEQRWLYLCMAMEAGGKKKFSFPKRAGEKYGICAKTLYRNTSILIEKGFIQIDSNSDFLKYKDTEYEFSMRWKLTSHRTKCPT